MQKMSICLAACLTALSAQAETERELDAHEHGVGEMTIAVEGSTFVVELHAPGADIVGFEYAASSEADLAAIEAAIETLSAPLDLFVMPEAAGCSLVTADAELLSEEGHDDHGHEDHAEDGHKDHDDHGHEDHAEEGHEDHDDHDHEAHAEDGHDDHDDHAEEASHTEFHAEFILNCANPDALTEINFAYFETFPNALELEIQIASADGATAFEVTREAPVLALDGAF